MIQTLSIPVMQSMRDNRVEPYTDDSLLELNRTTLPSRILTTVINVILDKFIHYCANDYPAQGDFIAKSYNGGRHIDMMNTYSIIKKDTPEDYIAAVNTMKERAEYSLALKEIIIHEPEWLFRESELVLMGYTVRTLEIDNYPDTVLVKFDVPVKVWRQTT